LLVQKLVLVHFHHYDEADDKLFVRLYQLKSAQPLTTASKMVDPVVRVQLGDAKFRLPDSIDFCVQNNLVNVNLLLPRIKGCYIVMTSETLDWFVRKSDWRRVQSV
jgi:hypothetical protein